MSSVIYVLDEITANQIAAGEVVERPAAVVKELVENSIDAGSTNIEIEIKDGGLSFIRVSDNGVGMTAEDARLSVERHATSKIKTAEDLSKVGTLGFRGEALPSIAAVSKFALTTRQFQDDLAVLLTIEGGVLKDVEPTGAGCGTTITVSDIFYNLPARRKFLKTPATEGGYISEIVEKLALSHPEISFKLIQNKKLTLATNGNGNLFDVLTSVYGSKAGENLLLIPNEPAKTDDISVSGYVGKPNMLKSNRTWQTFIVNDRVVTSRIIVKAIDNAYFSLLPKSGYPLIILRILLDAEVIDVNVHPQKKEIKFSDEQKIYRAVYNAVLSALTNKIDANGDGGNERKAIIYDQYRPRLEKGFRMHAELALEELAQHELPPLDKMPDAGRQTQNPANWEGKFQGTKEGNKIQSGLQPGLFLKKQEQPSLTEAREIIKISREENLKGLTGDWQEQPSEKKDERQTSSETFEVKGLYPLGQVNACYIVAYKKDADDGLYIIDQHAAHERILYERLSKNIGQVPSQQLLVPILLDFATSDCDAIETYKDIFYQLGFSFEQVGPDTMRLVEIPADIPLDEAEPIVRQVLNMLGNLNEPTAQVIRHAYLQTAACRSAVKAGDVLTMRQMQALIGELETADSSYTCPHGRPSTIKFSHAELDKMFKRT